MHAYAHATRTKEELRALVRRRFAALVVALLAILGASQIASCVPYYYGTSGRYYGYGYPRTYYGTSVGYGTGVGYGYGYGYGYPYGYGSYGYGGYGPYYGRDYYNPAPVVVQPRPTVVVQPRPVAPVIVSPAPAPAPVFHPAMAPATVRPIAPAPAPAPVIVRPH